MDYIAITASICSLLVSIVSIVSVILKVNTSIVELKCAIDNLAEKGTTRENKTSDLEERVRKLEIKSANCGHKQ